MTKLLYEAENYIEAYQIYNSLGNDYKDVDTILKDKEMVYAARELKLTPYRTSGSIVTFGRYEQDNNIANGLEEIEWIVLDYDENDHKALLLSRYGLDAKPFNEIIGNITWEKCSLRSWMNDEFLRSAFTAEEQAAILTTAVDNSASQGYSEWDTDGGNNTQDQIFLLSYAEANRYLDVTYIDINNTRARVAPTAYAIASGAWTSSDNTDSIWAGRHYNTFA